MEDGEGSVITDGMDAELDQNESSNSVESSKNINNSDNQAKDQGKSNGFVESSSENEEYGKTKITDKGTKLDDNPIQAANQLRANAEAKAKKYEEFFSKPENVEAYLNDLRGGKPAQGNESQGDTAKVTEITDADIEKMADSVQTSDDVKQVLKGIIALTRGEIQKVKGELQGLTTGAMVKETNANVAKEIQSVQSKYSVLQKTLPDGSENPEFDKDLDETIGKMFLKMDFDPQTKTFKGQTSLMEVADMFMKAAKISESRGSRKAQTIIKDKRLGRVISGGTGTDNSEVDESKMSPSNTIASRIARLSGRKK